MAEKKQTSPEKKVREIRRQTRKKYTAEKKSGLYWKDYAERTALLNYAEKKAFIQICTITGVRSFLRLVKSV